MVLEITHPTGEVERIEIESAVSLIMPREADLLLRLAGLWIVEEFGGWDFRKYINDSWRRILVLKSTDAPMVITWDQYWTPKI